LTNAKIENGTFYFWIEIPLSVGTVGGLTKLHPLAKLSLEILQYPSAEELMKIIAVAGLAQNFAALKALTTTGIQQGHMKMHLNNILNQLEANVYEKRIIVEKFKGKTVSHNAIAEALHVLRTNPS
jgi:hydroxymethylglutaryl-CoA reductase